MKHMNLNRALAHKLRSAMPGIGLFFGIATVVLAGFIIGMLRIVTTIDGIQTSSIAGFGSAITIMAFVVGIVSIREDLRLYIQHGIGRRTIYVLEIIAVTVISLLLTIGERILVTLGILATRSNPKMNVFDMHWNLFQSQTAQTPSLGWQVQLEAIAITFAVTICTYLVGMLISLVFYRLNKLWTVVVAVGVPLLLFVGMPILLKRLNVSMAGPVDFITQSPWVFAACFLGAAALAAFFDWLLLRRAPIKPIVK